MNPQVIICLGSCLFACVHSSPTTRARSQLAQVRAGTYAEVDVRPTGNCWQENIASERHADSNLNGDATPEWVRAAEASCDANDNCLWRIATWQDGCMRVVGEFRARALEKIVTSADSWTAIRAAFSLSGNRLLLTDYVVDKNSYVPTDTQLCTRIDVTRVACIPQ